MADGTGRRTPGLKDTCFSECEWRASTSVVPLRSKVFRPPPRPVPRRRSVTGLAIPRTRFCLEGFSGLLVCDIGKTLRGCLESPMSFSLDNAWRFSAMVIFGMVENGTNWRRSYETATMPAIGSKKLEPIGNETGKLPRFCKSEAGSFSDSGSQTSNAIPKLQWKRSWKHSAQEPDRFCTKIVA